MLKEATELDVERRDELDARASAPVMDGSRTT